MSKFKVKTRHTESNEQMIRWECIFKGLLGFFCLLCFVGFFFQKSSQKITFLTGNHVIEADVLKTKCQQLASFPQTNV